MSSSSEDVKSGIVICTTSKHVARVNSLVPYEHLLLSLLEVAEINPDRLSSLEGVGSADIPDAIPSVRIKRTNPQTDFITFTVLPPITSMSISFSGRINLQHGQTLSMLLTVLEGATRLVTDELKGSVGAISPPVP